MKLDWSSEKSLYSHLLKTTKQLMPCTRSPPLSSSSSSHPYQGRYRIVDYWNHDPSRHPEPFSSPSESSTSSSGYPEWPDFTIDEFANIIEQ